MNKQAIIIFIVSVILSACNNGSVKNSVPETGSIDSTAIAQDTAMQTAIESSYEYHKTLNVSEKLVYDIIAYGGSASIGQYAIISRGADNKPDTVAHGEREGIIVNTFLADLNKNGNNEIYIVLQSVGSGSYGNVMSYELDKGGNATALSFPDTSKNNNPDGYMGKDSIYQEGAFLVRKFPVFKKNDAMCCPAGGKMSVYYTLNKNKFSISKTEKE